ncbi:MAG: hypothetical protein WCH10_02695 [bacterium]
MFTLPKKRTSSILSISVLLILLYSSIVFARNESEWIIKNQHSTNSVTITIPAPAGSSTGVPSLVTVIMHGAEGQKSQRQRTYSYSKKRRKEKANVGPN